LKKPAITGWDELCAQQPEAAARAFDFLRADPRNRTDRNHRLKGNLATGYIDGRPYERWQHETTGAGRIFFLIDDARTTVWFEEVSMGHPKTTER
jgi:hypothetical protein